MQQVRAFHLRDPSDGCDRARQAAMVQCFVRLGEDDANPTRPMLLPADLRKHDRGSLAADLLAAYECGSSTAAGRDSFAEFKVQCAAELGRVDADPATIMLGDLDGCNILDFDDILPNDTVFVTFEMTGEASDPNLASSAAPPVCAPLAAPPRTGAPAAASAAGSALESPDCLTDRWLGVPTEHFGTPTPSMGLARYLAKVSRQEGDQVNFLLVVDGNEHSAPRATVREWLLPVGEAANAVKGMLRKLPPEQTLSVPAPAAAPAAAVTTTAPGPAPASAAAALSSANGTARSHQHDAPPAASQPGSSTRFQGHLAVGKLVRAAFTDANFVSRKALGIVVSGDANRQESLYVLCHDFAPDRGTGVYKFNVTPAGALKQVKSGSQGTYRVQ